MTGMPKFWNEMFERVVGPALDIAYRQGYEDGLAARTETTAAPAVERCGSKRVDSADATHVHECRCPRNTHRYSPIAGSIHECEWCPVTWSHEGVPKRDPRCRHVLRDPDEDVDHAHRCRYGRLNDPVHDPMRHKCDMCEVEWNSNNPHDTEIER